MKVFEKASLSFIKFARKHFRNTWIHKLPFTSWVYKKLFSHTYSGTEKEFAFRGNRYLLPTKDTSMVPSIINQDYEVFELDIFTSMLKPGMVVLDIGANLGIYSTEASKAVGQNGKVYAFEPIPDNLRMLKHNLKLNNADNVEVVPCAIGNTVGKEKIYLAEANVGTHSMGGKSKNFIEVDTNTIDNFAKSKRLGKIDFIKMDIEGFEAQAISGGESFIAKNKTPLFMEFSANHLKNCGTDPTKFAAKLIKMYTYCYILDEKKKRLKRVTASQEVAKSLNINLLLANKSMVATSA